MTRQELIDEMERKVRELDKAIEHIEWSERAPVFSFLLDAPKRRPVARKRCAKCGGLFGARGYATHLKHCEGKK